jgi:shikimate 5-dehydrogenase
MNAARSKSIAVVDGFALLVGQGALSFELFTGRPAPVEVMRMAARSR